MGRRFKAVRSRSERTSDVEFDANNPDVEFRSGEGGNQWLASSDAAVQHVEPRIEPGRTCSTS